MAAPPAQLTFLERLYKSRLVSEDQVSGLFPDPDDLRNPQAVADGLVKVGLLTRYQVQMLNAGKHRGFFLGPYKILRPLGQGGMGTVFLAEHTSLSRKVAVKVLPPDKAKDRLTLERFNREARAAAALDHPNIVRLHDISQGNGVNFLVMEYVEGTDLQSLMAQTGPLHYVQAAQYVAQAAAGLQHAHEKGFIHRDVKPANLMLTRSGGAIKILDMGLARSFTDAADNLTADLAGGDIAGTVDYLSPEQAMNQPLDERSDIYSLGATFYALVAGYPPFKGTTAQKLMQHQLKEPPSVSLKLSGRVPQALSDVVSKMMAKKPGERFQSAADVIDALGPWLPVPTSGNIVIDPLRPGGSGQTTPIRRSAHLDLSRPAAVTARPMWKRSAVLVGAAVGLVLLTAGVATAVALSGGKPEPTHPHAFNPPVTPNPDPTPTPVTPTGTPKPAATGPIVLYRLDASPLKPFRRQVDNADSYTGPNIRKEVPGWHYEVYDKDSLGEVLVEADGDRVVLGIGARSGKTASQFVFQPGKVPTLTLTAGHEYEVRVEYKTDGGVSAGCNVQTTGDWKVLANARLTATDTWKTHAVRFTRPEGKEVQITFGPSAIGEGFLKIRSVEVVDPSAPAAGRSLYALDLSRQKAFTDLGRTDSNGEWAWRSEQKSGDGSLPAGWVGFLWRLEDEGEYLAEAVDGRMALGFRTTRGKGSAMLFAPPVDFPSPTARLTVEYRTELGQAVNLQVRFQRTKPTSEKAVDVATLPPTDGRWRTETVDVELKGATGGFFELHNNHPNGATVHLRSLVVSDPTGVAATPPSAPGAHGPAVPVRADFTAFKAGTYPLDASGGSGIEAGPDWAAGLYAEGATGELTATSEDGATVVTLANKEGKPSAQLFQTKPGGTLVGGQAYLLKIEYRASADATGGVEVRERDVANWMDCPFAFPLTGTDDRWEKRTFEVEPTRDYPAVFVVQNHAEAGRRLSVRSMELVPVGVAAAPPPARDERVAYELTLTGQKAFAVRRKARDTTDLSRTGDGTPPAGWRSHSWEATCEHELFADTRDGSPALGLRFVGGKAAGMMAVDGITVKPNSTYELTFEYLTPGEYTGDNGFRYRSTGNGGKLYLGGKLDKTDGRWVEKTVTIKTDAISNLQLEFHHNGPGGEGNPLLLRKCKLSLVP